MNAFHATLLIATATLALMSCDQHRKDPMRPVEKTPPPDQPQQGVPPQQDINGAVSPGTTDSVRP